MALISDDLLNSYESSLGLTPPAMQNNSSLGNQSINTGSLITDDLLNAYEAKIRNPYEDASDRLLKSAPKEVKQRSEFLDGTPNAYALGESKRAGEKKNKANEKEKEGFLNKAIGIGESILALGTGATSGFLGTIADEITKNTNNPTNLSNSLTYEPKTVAGQDYIGKIGELIDASKIAGLAPNLIEVQQLGRTLKPDLQRIGNYSKPIINTTSDAIKRPINEVREYISNRKLNADIGDSVGAMRADKEALRNIAAQDLPIPIKLTKGEATRNFDQLRFEREIAKDAELGQPLRDRAVENNANLYRNFDAFIDETGARAIDRTGAGIAVDEAIQAKVNADKAKIRAEYKKAKEAGELAEPVATNDIIAFLDENMPDSAFAPIIKQAKSEIERLQTDAISKQKVNAVNQLPLDDLERLRKFANNSISSDPSNLTNIKFANDLKNVIDSVTENKGGEIYKNARRLRAEYANNYENRAVISDLLSSKSSKFSGDRKVPLEKVVDRLAFNSTVDDLKFARRTLQLAGEKGKQAWREVQAGVLRRIKEEAFGNSATDIAGNPVISAAKLDKIIKELDRDNKIVYLFGKKGAEQLRKLNEITKLVATSPAGVVNTSNTASVLGGILDSIGSYALTGVPVQIVASYKALKKQVAKKKNQKRIAEALK